MEDSQGGSAEDSQGGSVEDSQGGSVEDSQGGSVEDSQGGSAEDSQGGSVEDSQGGSVEDSQGGSVEDSQGGSVEPRLLACEQGESIQRERLRRHAGLGVGWLLRGELESSQVARSQRTRRENWTQENIQGGGDLKVAVGSRPAGP